MDHPTNPSRGRTPRPPRSRIGPGTGALIGAATGATVVVWELLYHPGASAKMEPGFHPVYLLYVAGNSTLWASLGAALGAFLGLFAKLVVKGALHRSSDSRELEHANPRRCGILR